MFGKEIKNKKITPPRRPNPAPERRVLVTHDTAHQKHSRPRHTPLLPRGVICGRLRAMFAWLPHSSLPAAEVEGARAPLLRGGPCGGDITPAADAALLQGRGSDSSAGIVVSGAVGGEAGCPSSSAGRGAGRGYYTSHEEGGETVLSTRGDETLFLSVPLPSQRPRTHTETKREE